MGQRVTQRRFLSMARSMFPCSPGSWRHKSRLKIRVSVVRFPWPPNENGPRGPFSFGWLGSGPAAAAPDEAERAQSGKHQRIRLGFGNRRRKRQVDLQHSGAAAALAVDQLEREVAGWTG